MSLMIWILPNNVSVKSRYVMGILQTFINECIAYGKSWNRKGVRYDKSDMVSLHRFYQSHPDHSGGEDKADMRNHYSTAVCGLLPLCSH